MNETPAAPDGPFLVLVTGVGRSGTSMMSGTLHHLGLSVPGPYLGANGSNPKGFFESRWAVRFHNQLAEAAGIYVFDSRPEALERVQAVISPRHRARLDGYLDQHLVHGRVTVVKDPRTVWTHALWREAVRARGAGIAYVAMLRHPAEVAASRSTYYAGDSGPEQRQRYQITSVARWINNTLISESQTRGEPRAFVRYTDMLSDWRSVMRTLGEQLGIDYPVALDAPNPADEFIDPGLRRHEAGWEDLALPPSLQSLGQRVWEAVQELVDDPASLAASSRLDECARDYREYMEDASAVAQDWVDAAGREARAATTSPAADPVSPPSAEQRAVQDVRFRELLGVLASRGTRRLRRLREPRTG